MTNVTLKDTNPSMCQFFLELHEVAEAIYNGPTYNRVVPVDEKTTLDESMTDYGLDMCRIGFELGKQYMRETEHGKRLL